MIKLTSISSLRRIKALAAIGALALAFASPAGAESALAAQDFDEPFSVAADGDLGYLPFQLGSPVGEEAAPSTTLAQDEPFEAGFPEDGIVLAGGFDFD